MSNAVASDLTVLSFRQPFASLVLSGWKVVENRTWSTDYRGRLYIHASGPPMKYKFTDVYGYQPPEDFDPTKPDVNGHDLPGFDPSSRTLVTGVILGSVELLDVIPLRWKSKRDGKFRPDPIRTKKHYQSLLKRRKLPEPRYGFHGYEIYDVQYHWLLADPQVLDEPIPAKGKLRLWTHPRTSRS